MRCSAASDSQPCRLVTPGSLPQRAARLRVRPPGAARYFVCNGHSIAGQ
jgi:hypothetical protein